VAVTDRDGNQVEDGTRIALWLIDTVITQGNSGSTTVDSDVLTFTGNGLVTRRCDSNFGGNEADNCVDGINDFQSTVLRFDSIREIRPGDFVVLSDGIDPADRFRRVLAVNGPNAIQVDAPYSRSYANVKFWVGTAESGNAAAGLLEGQPLTAGEAFTRDGIAEFRVTYTADVQNLGYGCFGYLPNGRYASLDRRDAVPQSRQVILAAVAPNGISSVDIGRFCSLAINGGTVTPSSPALTLSSLGQTEVVGLTVRDGGDQVRLAYEGISCGIENLTRDPTDVGDFNLEVTVLGNADNLSATGHDGSALVRVTRLGAIGGGSADVVCRTGDVAGTPATITVDAP